MVRGGSLRVSSPFCLAVLLLVVLMADFPQNNKERFLYPLGRYYGEFTPEQLTFNANLQEFAQRVSMLCALETNGKISAEQTYQEIKQLWHLLKQSKENLLDRPSSGEKSPE